MMKENNVYKFYKYTDNPEGSDYCFCQRPCDSNMSLRCFLDNGEILGFMSESLVYEHDNIKEIDMNEFMHDFVKPLIKENFCLKSQLDEKSSELKDAEEEYNRIFSLWHNRKLIKKFDDEYDKEDKKENPKRNCVYVMPDAEEVYKRYYELKDKIEDLQKKNAYFEKYLSEDFDILKKGIQYMIKKYIKSTVEMYVFKMNMTDSYTVSLVYEGESSSWDLYMPNIFDEKYMKAVAKGLCSNLSKITGKEEDYFFKAGNL